MNRPGPQRSALIDRRLHRAATRLIGVGVVIVAALAALVWQNSAQATDSLDRQVATALYARPGSPTRSLFAAVTVGGKPVVVVALTLIVAAWAWRRHRDPILAAFCPIAVGASSLVEKALKTVVGRSRPATAMLAHESSRSFPSGHATAATALATTVALVLIATGLPRRRRLVAVLAAYSVVISASRLVLGVHFLTDVIAGTALGVGVPLAVALAVTSSRHGSSKPPPVDATDGALPS